MTGRQGQLGLVLAGTWVVLGADARAVAPPAWPASGLVVGLLLGCRTVHRRLGLLGLATAAVLVALFWRGVDAATSTGLALVCAVEAWLVLSLLLRGEESRRPALLDEGDVSRTIGAVAVGAMTSALGYAAVLSATGTAHPWLVAVATAGTHAASLMVLLPFFVRTPTFPPIAALNERAVQAGIAVGTTVVIFSSADVPPAVFIVMPMFAWLGYRGSLREASAVLVAVSVVATAMTAWHVGPVWGLESRYDLAPGWSTAFMQLFLLDCGLILLPLSVSVTQQPPGSTSRSGSALAWRSSTLSRSRRRRCRGSRSWTGSRATSSPRSATSSGRRSPASSATSRSSRAVTPASSPLPNVTSWAASTEALAGSCSSSTTC